MTTTPELALAGDFPDATTEQWRALVDKVLKGADFDRKLVSTTYDGIAIQPLYTASSTARADREQYPGQGDRTRGPQASGPPHGAWEIRQTQSHPDPAEANRRILEDLDGGAGSLALRLDVGGAGSIDGVVVAGADDVDRLLDGVLLDLVTVVLEAGASFVEAADLLVDRWDRSGVSGDQRRGSLGADPLGVLASSGSLRTSVDTALAQVAALARRSADWPHVRAVDVDTAPYVDAGASEVEELALALAAGGAYLRALVADGLAVDVAARQIGFTLAADADVFATIAKIRAARRVWSHLLAAVGATDVLTPFAVRTATRMVSARDPWVNMLRTTAACFAAGAAGASSVTVQPFDAALGQPDELARRIARNTQLILQEESHIGSVIDPAGGSYYLEQLTDELTDRAWARFQEIEAAGGLAAGLADGSIADRLGAIRAARQANIGRRKDPLTGVSEFPHLAEPTIERPGPDVVALRAEAAARWSATPPAADAASVTPLPVVRLAADFEQLRDASDAHLASTGHRPSVFLANLGPVATHTGRATFARNFYEAGGVAALGDEGYVDDASLVEAFRASGSSIAVICSSDAVYADRVVATAASLVSAGAKRIVLAGNPGEHRDAWQAAGVEEFIHVGVDVLSSLRGVHQLEGVSA